MQSSKPQLEALLNKFLNKDSPPDIITQSQNELTTSLKSFTFKDLTELSNTLQKKSLSPNFDTKRISMLENQIKKLFESQIPLTTSINYKQGDSTGKGKLKLDEHLYQDKEIRKVVTVLTLNGLLEKKQLTSKYSVLKTLSETNLQRKIFETSMQQQNQSTASMILMDQGSRNPSPAKPNKSMIAQLVSKRAEKSYDFQQLQTQSYQCKLGGQLIRKIFLMRMSKALGKIKENRLIKSFTSKSRDHLLKILLKREELDTKRKLANVLFKWKSGCIAKPLAKGRLTNKLKGRLLLILSKHRSFLTKSTAFIRWKVKSDADMMKVTVDRFALFSKINMHTAFWRLKAVLPKKSIERKKHRRLERLLQAAKLLTAVVDKSLKHRSVAGFHNVRDYAKLQALRIKCLISLNQTMKRNLALTFEKWKQACIHHLLLDLRRVAVKGLLKAGNHLQFAFHKWKEYCFEERVLHERLQGLKALQKGHRGPQFSFLIRDVVNKHLKVPFDLMKQNATTGDMKKSMAMTRLYIAYSRRIAEALKIWNDKSLYLRREEQKVHTFATLETLNEALKNNLNLILNNGRESQIKLVALRYLTLYRRIFENTKTRWADSLKAWRKAAETSKLRNMLDSEKKAYAAKKIESILRNKVKDNQRAFMDGLKNLQKEDMLKRRVFVALMRTNTGKMKQAWDMWKMLPSKKDLLKQQNVSELGQKLNNMILRKKRQAFEGLKEGWYEIRDIKRQACRAILLATQSKQKTLFDRWSKNVKDLIHALACKGTISLVEIMNEQLRNNLEALLVSDRTASKKGQILKLIFENMKTKRAWAFLKWKKDVDYQKLKNMMKSDREAYALKFIDNFIRNKEKDNLKHAFDAITEMERVRGLKKRVFVALMRTSTGKLKQAWDHWRMLPSKKDMLKQQNVSELGQKLNNMLLRKKRQAFEGLKEGWFEIRDIKRQACRAIILATQSKQKTLFDTWAKNVKDLAHALACRATISLVEMMNEKIRDNLEVLVSSDKQVTKKGQALRFIFENMKTKRAWAFLKWKKDVDYQKLKNMMKSDREAYALKFIDNFIKNKEKDNLKQAFDAITEMEKVMALKKRVFVALMRTNTGKLKQAWDMWKMLPSKKDALRQQNVSELGQKLNNMLLRKKRQAFEGLKEGWYEIRDIKRQACRVILLATQSKQKTLFDRWAKNVKDLAHALACRATINLIEMMNEKIRDNLEVIVSSDKQTTKKAQAIRMIIENMKTKRAWAFLRWKKDVDYQKLKNMMKSDRDAYALRSIDAFIRNKEKDNMKQAFAAMTDMERLRNLKKRVFVALMRTSTGKLKQAWDHWRLLPSKKDLLKQQNLSELGQKLNNLILRKKRMGFEELKEGWYKIRDIKKQACRMMILATQGKQKTMFDTWAKNVKDLIHALACRATINLVEMMNEKIRDNLEVIVQSDKQVTKKGQAIR